MAKNNNVFTSRPALPVYLRRAAQEYTKNTAQTNLTFKERGSIIGAMRRLLGSDRNRYIVLGYLFTPPGMPMNLVSSKTLNAGGWEFMVRWVGMHEVEGMWIPHPAFDTEVVDVYIEGAEALGKNIIMEV